MQNARALEYDQDAYLVERAREGDPDAFDRLFQKHFPKVYGFAVRLLGDADTAQDAAQGAFIRAYNGLGKIRDGQAFVQYVYKAALNLVRDRARAQKRRPTASLQAPSTPEPSGGADATDGPVLNDARQAALESAIKALPDEFREVVVLHHLQEMDLEQISAIIGRPLGTVKSRLGRGRTKLREMLKDWSEMD